MNHFAFKVISILTITILISGCATIKTPSYNSSEAQECLDDYNKLDDAIIVNKATDIQYARVNGFSYLRSSRYLASLEGKVNNYKGFTDWLTALNNLSRYALSTEFDRLPEERKAALFSNKTELRQRLKRCGSILVRTLSTMPEWRQTLRHRTKVKSSYSSWQRVAGLYPVVAAPFRLGERNKYTVQREQEDLFEPNIKDHYTYAYVTKTQKPEFFPVSVNMAGIPKISSKRKRQLLHYHAPQIAMPDRQSHNRIGTVTLDPQGEPYVNIDQSTYYTWVDFGRFQGETTIRLNYSFWFEETPRKNQLDMRAGKIDGLTWRVHLKLDGTAIARDVAHNCGCNYRIYPSNGFTVQSDKSWINHPIYVGPELSQNRTQTLFLEADSHQVIAVKDDVSSSQKVYRPVLVTHYNKLKRLNTTDGAKKSIFNERGIITGSERLERFVLWPTGITKSGSMRVAGSQPISKLSKNHFDDAFLLEDIGVTESNAQDLTQQHTYP